MYIRKYKTEILFFCLFTVINKCDVKNCFRKKYGDDFIITELNLGNYKLTGFLAGLEPFVSNNCLTLY